MSCVFPALESNLGMTTHSLLHTGDEGQTHLFIYLFENWLKYVHQMSFLPENVFNLEMMDKAFAEKQEKERKRENYFSPKLLKTKCIHVY